MTTDLFIKTCAKDLEWLIYCLRSIDRHATGFRHVVIVTDPGDPVVIETSTPSVWLKSPPVPPGARFKMPNGYWWQMAVKLSWPDFTDADAVVITDSDCVFTGPVSPATWHREGRPIWFVRPWASAGPGISWKPSADYFLGHPSPACHMCRNGFLLTREATEGVRAYMRKRFNQTPWQYVVDQRHVKPEEYEMMGGYLATVDRHGYEFVHPDEIPDWPLRQYWSWGGLKPQIRSELDALTAIRT